MPWQTSAQKPNAAACLWNTYDLNFSVTPEQTETDCSINPVKQLWEWNGICFPGKGVLSTWNQGESKKCY